MSDLSCQCDGCGHPGYDCHCNKGGWQGTAITADSVIVSGSDVVFWMYADHATTAGYYPASIYHAIRVDANEPSEEIGESMTEMYSTKEAAAAATIADRI